MRARAMSAETRDVAGAVGSRAAVAGLAVPVFRGRSRAGEAGSSPPEQALVMQTKSNVESVRFMRASYLHSPVGHQQVGRACEERVACVLAIPCELAA